MKTQNDWGVLVSQTATEVIAVSEMLGFLPSLLVTNNLSKIPSRNLEILRENSVEIVVIPFRPVIDDYLIAKLLEKKLITLHGFLRILPAEFFNYYRGSLFNGHPGLITKYEELKGKDPQIRAWNGKYDTVGSVVHRVTEGVDEGEVVKSCSVPNTAQTLDEMYYILRTTSLQAWKNFFEEDWKFD